MLKKRQTLVAVLAVAVAGIAPAVAHADVIAQWNFNSNPADGSSSTGSTTPSIGSGTVSLTGGTTATFASGTGSSDTAATDNTGYNITGFAAQGTGNNTAGLKVAVDTTGFTDITISLDFRQSGTASRDFQLLVSSDGVNFSAPTGGTSSFGSTNSTNTLTSFSASGLYVNNSGGGSQNFVDAISYTLPSGSAYENNPNFAYEWVATFDAGTGGGTQYIDSNHGAVANYATSGTARFDMVTVSGTSSSAPEPASLGVLAIGGVCVLGRRRK